MENNSSSPFLSDFLFGTASSAYQYEGAYLTDGKGLNNWDVFTHKNPGKIVDGSNGDIADDQYHRFMEDIQSMIHLGVNSYRLSISWSRVLPRIKPLVTLNHFDYPQVFEDKFQSWLSPAMQKEFSMGNSETEPFIVAHNMILAHTKAVQIYRTKYQKSQRGIIGMVAQTSWFEPISDSHADKKAAERAQSFYSNWILDPVVYGRYPKEMVDILGSALPRFSTSKTEGFALKLDRKGNVSIGELTDVDWQHIHPEGFRKMLNYLKDRYPNVPIFITENGYGHLQKPETTVKELLNDTKRIQFMSGYLDALQGAMRDGANVKGYFAWSLLDNFEWLNGYKLRFGLFHVDYTTLKRTPKQSASWYKNFIEQHMNT
ncbi:hypothetical protein AALP_AAs73986U000100, partial [Arabis alpina]